MRSQNFALGIENTLDLKIRTGADSHSVRTLYGKIQVYAMQFSACGNFPDNYKKSIRQVCNGCKRLLSHNTLSHNTPIACLCLDCCARLYHAPNSDLHVQENDIHHQLTVHSPSRRFCNWLNRDLWISHALWNHTGVLWRYTKRQTADQQKGRQLHVTTINYVEVNCDSFLDNFT